ncbi:MAG: hypothetical protein ACI9R3_005232 [Verrucomicrobiales bacterium]
MVESLSIDELRSLLPASFRDDEESLLMDTLMAVRWMKLDPEGALGDACDYQDLHDLLLIAWVQLEPEKAIARTGRLTTSLCQGLALVDPQQVMGFVEAHPEEQYWGAALVAMADRDPERMMQQIKQEEVKWEWNAPLEILVVNDPSTIWSFFPTFDLQAFHGNFHHLLSWAAVQDPDGAVAEINRRRQPVQSFNPNDELRYGSGNVHAEELGVSVLKGWLLANPNLTAEDAEKVGITETLLEWIAYEAPQWVETHFDIRDHPADEVGIPNLNHEIEDRILCNRDDDYYTNFAFEEDGTSVDLADTAPLASLPALADANPLELPGQVGSVVYRQCASFARKDPLCLADWINSSAGVVASEIREVALRALCNETMEQSPQWAFTWAACLPRKSDRLRLMTSALLAVKDRPMPPEVQTMVQSVPITASERRVLLGMIDGL